MPVVLRQPRTSHKLLKPSASPTHTHAIHKTQDFYHPLPAPERPHILGLTASPEGMEQDTRRRNNKGRNINMGLQHNLNAWLVTVPGRGPLRSVGVCVDVRLVVGVTAAGLIVFRTWHVGHRTAHVVRKLY